MTRLVLAIPFEETIYLLNRLFVHTGSTPKRTADNQVRAAVGSTWSSSIALCLSRSPSLRKTNGTQNWSSKWTSSSSPTRRSCPTSASPRVTGSNSNASSWRSENASGNWTRPAPMAAAAARLISIIPTRRRRSPLETTAPINCNNRWTLESGQVSVHSNALFSFHLSFVPLGSSMFFTSLDEQTNQSHTRLLLYSWRLGRPSLALGIGDLYHRWKHREREREREREKNLAQIDKHRHTQILTEIFTNTRIEKTCWRASALNFCPKYKSWHILGLYSSEKSSGRDQRLSRRRTTRENARSIVERESYQRIRFSALKMTAREKTRRNHIHICIYIRVYVYRRRNTYVQQPVRRRETHRID